MWLARVSCGRFGSDNDSAECIRRSDDVLGPTLITVAIIVLVALIVWWRHRRAR